MQINIIMTLYALSDVLSYRFTSFSGYDWVCTIEIVRRSICRVTKFLLSSEERYVGIHQPSPSVMFYGIKTCFKY